MTTHDFVSARPFSLPHPFATRRCVAIGGVALLAVSWLHEAVGRAQNREEEAGDTVVFKSSTIPFRGTIVEYTGEAITIRLKNGKTRRFPSSDVLRFETKRSDAWLEAVEHYEAHEYILAATDFEKAFEQEPRTWVRREVLAQRRPDAETAAMPAFIPSSSASGLLWARRPS